MTAPNYFIPARDRRAFYPLHDFLRAPSISVAKEYIQALTAPDDLVIDPFGAMPNVAYAAYALGRRAIVVESNPLWAWLARAMSTLPPASEIDSALTKLGDALKDDAPLRAHIAQLYTTLCAACGKPTPADYFIRSREGGILARHYTCAHCHATRDDTATEDDLKRAQSFDARGLHYHLAFERVAPEDALYAERIHKMLDVYTPRNLYALVTLTQKIDSLFRAARERNILLLLLLHLLARGAAFHAQPDASPQIKVHKEFVEFNLWREIETAARALGANASPLPLADSVADVMGDAERAPRVFIGRGNAQTLAREIPRRSVALVMTAPPSRRMAIWTLAYLWGAWVLGRAAVQSLIPFLDAKRDHNADWRWYSETLGESLNASTGLMRPDTHIVFAFDEAWHLVIESLLLAAAGAHLELEALLFQPRVGELSRREFDDLRGEYRLTFTKRPPLFAKQLDERIRELALVSASDILTRRGEALAYSWVHHAAFARIAREGLLTQAIEAKMKSPPGRFVHQAVVAGLSAGYAEDFDHYESSTQFVWLRRAKLAPPLIDRIDDAVHEILSRGKVSREDLEDAIYRQFPGDLTPEAGLIELCASAYGKANEEEKARTLDMLKKLGERLGYQQKPEARSQKSDSIENFTLAWFANGEIAHGFVWRDRARFADLTEIQVAPARGYLVVPESLVALMQEKTRRLPHFADLFRELGWNFLRASRVKEFLNQETIEPNDIERAAGIETAPDQGKQLELL